ncbi:MAG: DUF1549 and DUF1553 domain-containing protein [bacterium]|nr:DUF1549 and DUF1553 domain-containing protein [bacterium]
MVLLSPKSVSTLLCLLLLVAPPTEAADAPLEKGTLKSDASSGSWSVDQSRPISFELDVQPVLTKYGCNSGPCHGKQRGQNGFQLSLLGFDSDFDYAALMLDARGRRVFPASPENSLLLEKTTGQRPHGGGKRFELDSEAYRVLLSWIRQGSRRSLTDEPQLLGIRLEHSEFSLEREHTGQLRVTADYSDGTRRDVSDLASYLSNHEPIARVDEGGQIAAGRLPGETAIMARYMNHIAVADVIIPYASSVDEAAYSGLESDNLVDQFIVRKLKKTGLAPSPPADDSTFLRRVYTDLIGRLPTYEEARDYLDSNSPHKRSELVQQLLDSPDYVDHWANQWADLLRPNPYRVGIKAVLNYDNWIRQQFRDNVRYDEFVTGLVTAKGSTWRNGATTLFRDRRSPDEMATLVSQLFLGIRLECAKCHHHPFEKWSQRDFYQFAAYFARVGHKGTGLSPPISGGEETVFVSKSGSVKHPRTGQELHPQPLFGSSQDDFEDPRESLASWMTSAENEYFAQVQVNRLWAALMGRGLVEPVDDLRSTNPASNQELLTALAREFVHSGYDCKHILRLISLSNAYALSSQPHDSNAGDLLNYSRHYRHRLRAEVLLDAIASITETPHSIQGMPAGSRSNQIWTHRVSSMFLDTFGRPDANQDPPCERTAESTVTQALHLMNSNELDRRLRSDNGRAARLAASSLSAEAIVEELYLAIYSRYPTDDERRIVVNAIANASTKKPDEGRRLAIEDVMWAMLNTPEFTIQN